MKGPVEAVLGQSALISFHPSTEPPARWLAEPSWPRRRPRQFGVIGREAVLGLQDGDRAGLQVVIFHQRFDIQDELVPQRCGIVCAKLFGERSDVWVAGSGIASNSVLPELQNQTGFQYGQQMRRFLKRRPRLPGFRASRFCQPSALSTMRSDLKLKSHRV